MLPRGYLYAHSGLPSRNASDRDRSAADSDDVALRSTADRDFARTHAHLPHKIASDAPRHPPAHSHQKWQHDAPHKIAWAEYARLGGLVVVWYATSGVCFITTKQLDMHWSVLTLAQLSVSTILGWFVLRVWAVVPYQSIASFSQVIYLYA